MAGCTVRVRGFPDDLPPDRVADKLTIHFLRSRNGGGEIADLQVLPGPRPYALITFEALEVAQRILEVKEHVLLVGGKKFRLEVTPHVLELSPDEIFIRACVIVDYGKIPSGKTLLTTLLKGYSNVHFTFTNTQCMLKGPFTELQAFSRELLGSLNLQSQAVGEILPPASSPVAREPRIHGHQPAPTEPVPAPNWDQVHEKTDEVPSPRRPVDGAAVEQLEDFSLVMDSDIYLYMQRFCSADYQGVLRQHRVDVVDVGGDGISTLYLQPAAGLSGDTGAVRQARLALQQLHQQLEVNLRKEKIAKSGLGVDSQALRALTHRLQKLYPQLLCHQDEKQLYLIGNLSDVFLAKQYLQDLSTGRGAAHTVGTLGSSQPSPPATSRTSEAALSKAREPVDTSASRLSPGRQEMKGELKLAANFSSLKADRSQASQGLLLNQDSPAVGQEQLTGKRLSETDALGPSDPTALTQQYQPRVSTTDVVLGSAAESQQKEAQVWDHVKEAAGLTSRKALSASGSKENSSSQHPGASKGSGPIKHHSLVSTSGAFDTPRTSSAVDSRPRPPLRRSSSFSLPRPKENDTPQGSEGRRVSEELSLDFLQWTYLKDVCRAALAELGRDGGVQVAERRAGDCMVLTLQARDRSRLSQAKWKVEALVQKCPDLVCHSMSYSELPVDGPEDSALSDLCSLLQGNSLRVGVSKDKHKLHLAYPREMVPAVREAFRVFSSRRLHALKSSSLSPGTESREHPSVSQPSRSQDTVLDAALSSSLESLQMGLQHLNISDRANHADVLRAVELPEAEEKRLPSPRRFQQALGQEATDRADSGAVQGGSSFLSPGVGDKPSPAGPRESQEQLKRKLAVGEPDIARVKQVLPDKFQFARDRSRGGQSEGTGQLRSPLPAADGAPHSLPVWLHLATAAEAPEAAAQQPPGAEPGDQERALLPPGRSNEQEEPDLSPYQPRGPSPGQESSKSPLGRCDTCQGPGVTCQAPCGHSLCRACFAADHTQPACCSSSPGALSCKVSGTFKTLSMSQSLPGYSRDPTLQLVYNIPDGVQGVGDPHPGQPYKGGIFCAFLPDNKDGQKTAMLLRKAFERGLTFQIKSCNGEERVTWGLIPHKTSWEGGKSRNGYPDKGYLAEVGAVLEKLDLV